VFDAPFSSAFCAEWINEDASKEIMVSIHERSRRAREELKRAYARVYQFAMRVRASTVFRISPFCVWIMFHSCSGVAILQKFVEKASIPRREVDANQLYATSTTIDRGCTPKCTEQLNEVDLRQENRAVIEDAESVKSLATVFTSPTWRPNARA